MRIFMAIASGFALTLAVFAGGVAAAFWLLSAESVASQNASVDTTELWTNEAVRVDTNEQAFERLPAQHSPVTAAGESSENQVAEVVSEDGILVDTMQTAALLPGEVPTDPATNVAHVEWCFDRYRSYDPQDNGYTSYSGERRQCVSPYLDDVNEAADPGDYGETGGMMAALVSSAHAGSDQGYVDEDHIRACFSRYRSYRVEDNSYQPYGGGPRQQCL